MACLNFHIPSLHTYKCLREQGCVERTLNTSSVLRTVEPSFCEDQDTDWRLVLLLDDLWSRTPVHHSPALLNSFNKPRALFWETRQTPIAFASEMIYQRIMSCKWEAKCFSLITAVITLQPELVSLESFSSGFYQRFVRIIIKAVRGWLLPVM